MDELVLLLQQAHEDTSNGSIRFLGTNISLAMQLLLITHFHNRPSCADCNESDFKMSMTPASETFQAVEHCMLGLFSAKSFLRVDSHRYCWVSHAVAEHLLISLFVSVTKRYMCRCYCFAATLNFSNQQRLPQATLDVCLLR